MRIFLCFSFFVLYQSIYTIPQTPNSTTFLKNVTENDTDSYLINNKTRYVEQFPQYYNSRMNLQTDDSDNNVHKENAVETFFNFLYEYFDRSPHHQLMKFGTEKLKKNKNIGYSPLCKKAMLCAAQAYKK